MSTTYPAKRRHQRADLDIFVNKIIGDEPHLARVKNISAGGVYLYKLLEPAAVAEQPVGLEILLPNSPEIIWAVGEVARSDGGDECDGVAVEFTRMAQSDRELIEEYVQLFRTEPAPKGATCAA